MKKRNMMMAAISLMALSACTKVQPGNVGIKVNNWGGDVGVQASPLGVGYYYAGPGTSIYEYPVFTKTYTWTADGHEQSAANESFSFQDKNGLGLNADVSVAYHVNAEKAAILFQKYRMPMDDIVAGPLRNAVRSAVVTEAAAMGVEEIYGPRKAELAAKALSDVQHYFSGFGLEVEQLYWAGSIRVPDGVLRQINAKIANEQEALAAQANVQTAKANADAEIAKAEGKARAIQVEAAAIRADPDIVKMRAVEKWDGRLPEYNAGALPFITMAGK